MKLRSLCIQALIGFSFIALLASCGGAQQSGGDTAALSDAPAAPAAPAEQGSDTDGGGQISDFSLKDVDGRTRSLSEFLGKNVIVISFWATW